MLGISAHVDASRAIQLPDQLSTLRASDFDLIEPLVEVSVPGRGQWQRRFHGRWQSVLDSGHWYLTVLQKMNSVAYVIKEAPKRGKTNAVLSAIEGQRKARASVVDERKREAGTSFPCRHPYGTRQRGRQGRQIETEAAPIRCVAGLIGADTEASGRFGS